VKRSLLAFLAALAVLSPATAQANIVSKYRISIQSCVVNQNGGVTNGVNIVYVNSNAEPATEIDFQVNYRGTRYVLIDSGSFTQNANINHNLTNTLVGLPWSGPTPNLCTVRRVVLANGRVLQAQ
jgi:hypothetical protein